MQTYTQNFYVSGNHVDFAQCIHAHTLQSNLLDCAFAHADKLGVGRNSVQSATGGGVWVLIRLRVELQRPLLYAQEFTIDTWPTGTKGPYFGRDFVIRCGDKTVGKASSSWLITNPETKRIVRPNMIAIVGGVAPNTPQISHMVLDKIKPPEKLTPIGRHEVRYSDLDMNNHVNNTRYLAIAADALKLHERKQYITAWQINYIEQCVASEVIDLCCGEYVDGTLYVAGRVDGRRRFDMRVWLTTSATPPLFPQNA